MKLLIVPIIIALFAGIGGGSGYAYMRASKAFVADSAQRADSIKAHPPKPHAEEDSTAAEPVLHDVVTDSAGHDAHEHDVHEPETPADSMRALAAARASLKESTKGLHDAAPVSHATPETTRGVKPADARTPAVHATTAPAAHAAPVTEHSAKSDAATAPPKRADKPTAPSTGAVAAALRGARNEAMATALPEQRLAKIFGAMQAKEAGKVLDQMGDDDVRMILGMMSDRQAAAILSTFTAARAAAITRGVTRTPDIKP